MSTRPTTASYDAIPDFGLLYDSVPAYGARADVDFYGSIAAEVGGKVLEIGCGTGRVLLPIARRGVAITGIDSSAEMLARLESKVAAEPADVRSRIAARHADATDFDLGETFALVIAPFRVMQHLTSIDAQLCFLRAVERHMTPDGRFVFDVFNPYFSALIADRSAEAVDTPEFTLPDGRTFSRAARIPRVRITEQVSEIELIYYVGEGIGATPERYVQRFDMRWYLLAELTHLLARAGLAVKAVYGDFDRSPLTDTSPEQILVAEKALT